MERKILRHGFTLDKPEHRAIVDTKEAFINMHADEGFELVGEPEVTVIRTPETEANGEFIVRIEGEFTKTS